MRIGELAEAAGTTTKTLRFYEEQGLLPPAERTPAGYRDYTPDAVSRIDFVHRGQAAGLTLAQIKQILDIRDHGQAPCGHVRDLLDARLADIDAQIADLTTLRDNVAALRDDAALPEPETCSPDQVCRYL
ncbi:MerR family transcriptional regulator [Mycobacteroides abscessus]|nr:MULTISPECIES: heavy metal-responsive transcriptional regulator [Actinomycetes]MBI3216975.1 heavy metal-responsive transcriptional regulator [Mycobacterium sp.]AMY26268.1 Mercuric resistance operon regulatory protein [Rhodococcus fascians]ART74555.1 heavy metal-responsive transcriptional regulator [Mycobacterium dioxanotrophicus]AZI65763.1 heavy metal-responsive transcriptional regulator [Rhodococcus sp. NJ-530]KAA1428127.1 heavy metal-responsive transcriptional regulator [Mycolicibacter aru